MVTNLFTSYLFQQDNPQRGLGGEQDGVYHHNYADSAIGIQGSQADDPSAETET